MLESEESRAALREVRRERAESFLRGGGYNERTKHAYQSHGAKVVFTPEQKESSTGQIVALCSWQAPTEDIAQQPEKEPKAEKHNAIPDFKRALEFYKSLDEIVRTKSEEFIGPECHTHYWYLSSLATLPSHQQKGLGTGLLQWGIEKARADAAARPGKIKGV